ncbi:hypothetical protein GCM10027568_21740 [Humibacter soli]
MHFRIRTKNIALVAASAALVALLAGCASSANADSTAAAKDQGTYAQDSKTLVFSTLPSEDGTDSSKPVEDYIAKETGLTVKYVPTTSYSALIAAALAGKVDIANFGPASYATALNKGAKLTVVAGEKSEADQTDPGYYSGAIVATKNAPKYQTVSQFKGKKICFVDPTSTSGFLYPIVALKAAGIDVVPSGTDASGNPTFKDFTAYFAGSHDKSVQAVADGQCDVGFADNYSYDAANSGVTTIKDAKTAGDGKGVQLVPGDPIVVATALPAAMKTKLAGLLGGLTPAKIKAAGIDVPANSPFVGYAAETKDYYQPIYEACTDKDVAKAATAVCGG